MDCEHVRAAIFLFTDNEMEEDLVLSFRAHLERCPHCEREFDAARRLLVVLRERCARQAAPPSLRVRILASLPHRRGMRTL